MSLSNQTDLKNPAVKFFQWSSDDKCLKYYDKEKPGENGKKGANVLIKLPFNFIVLDTLSTIKGYSDEAGSGFWSNEIRKTTEDILTVRNKKGVCATGLYNDVITHRDCTGAKYCQSVYIAYPENKEFVIANIQIVGAALGSWIEFRKKNKIIGTGTSISGFTMGKKGKTTYSMPVFESGKLKDETLAKCIELDKELQLYLEAYLKTSKTKIAQQGKVDGIDEPKVEQTPQIKPITDEELGEAFPINIGADDDMVF